MMIFSISARSPKTMIAGQMIPIELCVGIDAARSTGLPAIPPEFELLEADYTFKEYMDMRGTHVREVDASPSTTLVHRVLTFATKKPTLDLDSFIDIGTMNRVGLPVISDKLPLASFESYNICRTYAARLIVKIACAGKTFEAEFKWTPVLVLPAEVVEEAVELRWDSYTGALGHSDDLGVLDMNDAAKMGLEIAKPFFGVLGDVVQ